MRKFLIVLLLPLLVLAQEKMLYKEKIEGIPYEDVKILLKTALDGKNMNVLAVQDVSQKPRMTVFYVCNLSYGEKILRTFPEFGALAPCRIYILEKEDGSVEVGYINIPNLVKGFRKYLTPQAQEVFLQADKDIKEAIKEVKGGF
ncbi:DUF302 domain-containing protein [Aquifex aeolicus]|uniref:Uncharacterized protein aq_1800 n=1 Tax=Aquifex aeolicus (strain VF5) TaxID=224324 RepID=Y1800_AQUAE|nr:DUF302 domain-containing protein [Aquifex aeolicus]O67669.1 RecName: Full=Uncharacterized protein aq_1800; Flags: Precursor [Aquifex aeolicus VF5]AAC07640.1 putative protein [Aquifex aeolicus VF5]